MKKSKVRSKSAGKNSEGSHRQSETRRDGLTQFQRRILGFIKGQGGDANTWEIAQGAFREKWTRRSGRGALIGHIDRAASKIPNMVRLPPRDQWGQAHFFYLPEK